MKKIQFLLLMVAVGIMPTLMASCEKDEPTNVNPPSNTDPEPEEDQFEDLYGYWINSDNTGAIEFTKSSTKCNVRYYAPTADGLKSMSSSLYSISSGFNALATDGSHTQVKIISNSKNRIVLEKTGAYNNAVDLSSYFFSRATENAFYDFLEGGSNDVTKLIGSWKYEDYTAEYILTFYSSGKAEEEVWIYGDILLYSESGTYKYSNGKITEWDIDGGSSFAQEFSDVPWTVTFVSSTKITLTGSGKYADTITLTKQ